MEEGSGRSHNWIIILIIIVVFTVYYMFFDTSATFSMADDSKSFTLYGYDDTKASFQFTDIESISLIEDPDYGEPVDGGTSSGNNYGTWKSDSFGTYDAFVKENMGICILVKDTQNTVAFNYENKSSTENLYESMVDTWETLR